MRVRNIALVLFTSLSALAADCDSTTGPRRLGVAGTVPTSNDSLNVALIRFVNATTTTVFDVAQGGVIDTGNGSLLFGQSSRCVVVAASSPILDVRQTGTNVTFPGFNLTLQGAGRYTIIAFTDVTGATQFATIFNNVFIPQPGQIGFSTFNAVSNGIAYDVWVTTPGAPLTSTTPISAAVLGGVNSGFIGVDVTTVKQIRITTASTTTVVLDLGNVTFIPDVNTTLVIAPPLRGTTTIRAFLVAGC
jgi:hypothetical protein